MMVGVEFLHDNVAFVGVLCWLWTVYLHPKGFYLLDWHPSGRLLHLIY